MDGFLSVSENGPIDPLPQNSNSRRNDADVPPPPRGRSYFAKRDRELGRAPAPQAAANHSVDAFALIGRHLGELVEVMDRLAERQDAICATLESIDDRLAHFATNGSADGRDDPPVESSVTTLYQAEPDLRLSAQPILDAQPPTIAEKTAKEVRLEVAAQFVALRKSLRELREKMPDDE